MANTWGKDRTGFDGRLYEIGHNLQNVGHIQGIRDAIEELQKIVKKIEKGAE